MTSRVIQQSARRSWLLGLGLVVAVLLVYLPAWHGGFIWDDDAYVTDNPLLTAPDGLWRIWFSLDSPSQYFPLTYTTFRIERALWGLNPTGYHLVNLLLHAANALLVWRLLRRLAVPGAWLAAALFALHPVQVESVAWITERKNVLSLFFSLLSLLAWVRFITGSTGSAGIPAGLGTGSAGILAGSRQTSQNAGKDAGAPSPRWRWYALALLFFALALFAKTTACTLPAALLLILWLKRCPVSRARLAQIVPFVLCGLAMGLLAMWWERYHQGTRGRLFDLDLVQRVLIVSRAIWFYAGKLLCPDNLMFSYPRWHINPADPLAYGWLAACVAFGAAVLFLRRFVGRSLEVAALFFAATLSPLLGFIMLYTFRYSFVADHYQYVACIGPLALAAAGLTRGWQYLEQRANGSAMTGSAGIPAGSPPPRPIGWGEGRGEGSSSSANLLSSPRFAFLPLNILAPVLCAALLLTLGALTWLQSSIYSDSQTLWRATLAGNPDSPLALYQFGKALLERGQTEDGIACYQRVLQIEPRDPDVHYNLGNVLLRQGQVDAAIGHYRQVLQIQPRDPEALNNLGNALFRQGQVDEAVRHVVQALEVRPDYADARNNLNYLAWVLATSKDAAVRNPSRALTLAEQVDRLSHGTNPLFLRTLATAYAEAGRLPEALATARRAFQLATAQNNLSLAATLQQQIQLYESRSAPPPSAH